MRNRIPILALLAANAISTVGNVVTLVAIPWFVLETTGSPAMAGVTAFFSAVAAIPAAFFGGVIVDRLGHKRASVISDVLSGVTVALIPLLYVTVGLEFWHLLALVFLGALLDAPGSTARAAIVPELSEMASMRLEKANAAAQAVFQASFLLGAPLGGVLVAAMGAANVLWLNAVTFALSAGMVGLLVPLVKLAAAVEEERGTYMGDLKAGLKFIASSRLLVTLVVTVMITNFLDSPMFSVVMPVYARDILGSSVDLGLIMGGFGAGAFAGAVLYGVLGHRFSRRATFVLAFVGMAIPLWVLVALPGQPIVTLGAIVTGVAAGPINPLIRTVIQERVPPMMRARILGTVSAGAYIAAPLSMALSGWVIEWIGLRATLFIYAASYLVLTLVLQFNPAVREMNVPGPFAQKSGGPSTRPQAGAVGA
ncbi:MAG TPA: MFS transporter [Chloroflexia bacterium]|nr:MFS transporter [Chloroflexia bacterium]